MLVLGDREIFCKQIQQALKLWIDTLAEVLREAGLDEKTAQGRAKNVIIQI